MIKGEKVEEYEVREDTEDQFTGFVMKVLVFVLSKNRKPLDDFE